MTPEQIEEMEAALDPENQPEYHEQGMGCGLEDRNITDRYEAMAFGWEQAMDRAYSEVVAYALDEVTTMAAHIIAQREQIAALEKRVKGGDALLAECFTVVEWVTGEGFVLPYPHADADDLLMELVPFTGFESSDEVRRATGGHGND